MSALRITNYVVTAVWHITRTINVWANAGEDLRLNDSFAAIAGQLPLIETALQECCDQLAAIEVNLHANNATDLLTTASACEHRTKQLAAIFEGTVAGESDYWYQRYQETVSKIGIEGKVDDVVRSIIDDAKILVGYHEDKSIRTDLLNKLDNAIGQLSAVDLPIPPVRAEDFPDLSTQTLPQSESGKEQQSGHADPAVGEDPADGSSSWVDAVLKRARDLTFEGERPDQSMSYEGATAKDASEMGENWQKGRYEHFRLPFRNVESHLVHAGSVYTVQISGTWLLSGGRDQKIVVWSLDSRRYIHGLSGHSGSVICLRFNPRRDENIIVSGSSDRSVIIWDFSPARIRHCISAAHEDSVLDVQFDQDHIYTCSKDRTIKVWNRRQTSVPRNEPSQTGDGVDEGERNPENQSQHSTSQDAKSENKQDQKIPPYSCLMILRGHIAAVNCIQVDGRVIVSGSGDRTIRAWDKVSGECTRVLSIHQRGIACLQLRGTEIVSGSNDHSVRITNLATGAEVAVLHGHTDLVRTVQIVQSESEQKPAEKGGQDQLVRSDSDKWDWVVSGSYDGSIIIWTKDAQGQWKTQHTLRPEAEDLVSSATAQSRSQALSHEQQEQNQAGSDPQRLVQNGRIMMLQADGRRLVCCTDRGDLYCWDFANETVRNFMAGRVLIDRPKVSCHSLATPPRTMLNNLQTYRGPVTRTTPETKVLTLQERGRTAGHTGLLKSEASDDSIATLKQRLALSMASYERTEASHYLDDVTRVLREIVNITADSVEKSLSLDHLARSLALSAAAVNSLSIFSNAVAAAKEALGVHPKPHPGELWWSYGLANPVDNMHARIAVLCATESSARYRTGTSDTLASATRLDSNWELDTAQNQSSRWYSMMKGRGNIQDSVQLSRELVNAMPPRTKLRMRGLMRLSSHLVRRYRSSEALVDLEEAIHHANEATRHCAKTLFERDPEATDWLRQQGDMYWLRYLRWKEIHNSRSAKHALERAIYLHEYAKNVDLAAKRPKAWGSSLIVHHMKGVLCRFGGSGTELESNETLRQIQQCLENIAVDDPKRAFYFGILADEWQHNNVVTFNPTGLWESVTNLRHALAATDPEDYDDWAIRTCKLADKLKARGTASSFHGGRVVADTFQYNDRVEALERCESCLKDEKVSARFRVMAGAEALKISSGNDWERAFRTAQLIQDSGIIKELLPRFLSPIDKHLILDKYVLMDLASNMASAMLSASGHVESAFRALEQGRELSARALGQLRGNIVTLQKYHPRIAERYRMLCRIIESPSASLPSLDQTGAIDRPVVHMDHRRNADRELNRLLHDIRRLPGFEDFLGEPSFETVLEAARNGPIVIVNCSHYRCDAILIDRQGMRTIKLPLLNFGDVGFKRRSRDKPEVLEWLWNSIASPILQELGITEAASEEKLPHIRWIPVGLIRQYPLHAAGCYTDGSLNTVLDRAVSSYASSVRALINAQNRATKPTISQSKVLLVAMDRTKEYASLPFAKKEVAVVQDLCDSMGMQTFQPPRCKAEVTQHLRECAVFHFAGHGAANERAPCHSSLLLEDWKERRLTIVDLIQLDLKDTSPFLAYLSACGTSSQPSGSRDEGLIMTAIFQEIGFRHAIGTLWDVKDQTCVETAKIVYETIKTYGMTDDAVARGLHKATIHLRRRWWENLRESKSKHSADTTAHLNSATSTAASPSHPVHKPLVRSNKGKRDAVICDDEDSDEEQEQEQEVQEEEEDLSHWIPFVHYGA